MTEEEYYTAPSQDIFDDIKENALRIWRTYDDTHGSVIKKIQQIEKMENIRNNAWCIVAMFDPYNTRILLNMVNTRTRDVLYRLLYDSQNE
jgi:ribosome maturation protein Sdo1